MMIFLFGSSSKDKRPKASHHHRGKRGSSPRPGLRGDEHRKAEGPFRPQAASPAPPRAGLQAKANPQPHTPLGSPLCCLSHHPQDLCPRTLFFKILSQLKPLCHRHFQGGRTRCSGYKAFASTNALPQLNTTFVVAQTRISSVFPGWSDTARTKSQNAQPEIETSIPQALLTAHVAKTSMAQALPLPPRGPTSRRKGSSPHRVAPPGQFPHCKTPAPVPETDLHTEMPVAVGLMRRTAEGKTQT